MTLGHPFGFTDLVVCLTVGGAQLIVLTLIAWEGLKAWKGR